MYQSLGAVAVVGGKLEIPCVNVNWRCEIPKGSPGYDQSYCCNKGTFYNPKTGHIENYPGDPCGHTTTVCSSSYNVAQTFSAQQQMLRDLGFNAGPIGTYRQLPAAWDAYSKSRGLPVPSRGGKLGEQHMRALISDWAGKWGVAAKEGAMPTYTFVHAATGTQVQAKTAIEAQQKLKNMGIATTAVATTSGGGVIAQYKTPQQSGGGGGGMTAAPETGSGILAAASLATGVAPRTLLWVAGGIGVLGLGYLATRKRKAA